MVRGKGAGGGKARGESKGGGGITELGGGKTGRMVKVGREK